MNEKMDSFESLTILTDSAIKLVEKLDLTTNSVQKEVIKKLQNLSFLVESSKKVRSKIYLLSIKKKSEKLSFDIIRIIEKNIENSEAVYLALDIIEFIEKCIKLILSEPEEEDLDNLIDDAIDDNFSRINEIISFQQSVLDTLREKFEGTDFSKRMKSLSDILHSCRADMKKLKLDIDKMIIKLVILDQEEAENLAYDFIDNYQKVIREAIADICQEILKYIPEE